jgi:hypothetical protein
LIGQIKVLIIAIVSLQIIESKKDFKYLVYGTFGGLIYILISLNGWKLGFFGISSSEYSANIDKFGRLLIQNLIPDRHTPINSNTWSSLTSISAGIFMVHYYFNEAKVLYKKYVLAFLFILIMYSTIDLGSRGALLGLLVSFVTLFYYQTPKVFYRNILIILILFISGSITVDFLATILPQDNEIIQSRLAESENEDPRVNIWLSGLNMAFKNFFTGVGIGNAGVEFNKYKIDAYFASDKLALHNSFLTHFAELGIIGLILFVRGMYLWQKSLIFRRPTKVLFVVVSMNILLNAFAHSFELENYFIAIIYSVHAYFLLEMKEAKDIQNQSLNKRQNNLVDLKSVQD